MFSPRFSQQPIFANFTIPPLDHRDNHNVRRGCLGEQERPTLTARLHATMRMSQYSAPLLPERFSVDHPVFVRGANPGPGAESSLSTPPLQALERMSLSSMLLSANPCVANPISWRYRRGTLGHAATEVWRLRNR